MITVLFTFVFEYDGIIMFGHVPGHCMPYIIYHMSRANQIYSFDNVCNIYSQISCLENMMPIEAIFSTGADYKLYYKLAFMPTLDFSLYGW